MRPSRRSPLEQEMRELGETWQARALGLRLSQRKYPKQVSNSSKELKVYLSVPQETNEKDTGFWCG